MRSLENIGGVLYAQGWMLIGTHKNQDYALFFRQPIPKDVAQDATLIEAARAKIRRAELYQKRPANLFPVHAVGRDIVGHLFGRW